LNGREAANGVATKLQLKFDPNQEYQLDAIRSVTGLFEGLPETVREFTLGDETVSNLPPGEVLYDTWLLERLAAVREQNGFTEPVAELSKEDGMELEGVSSNSPEPFPYFTIEMETGTGKTYVYFRTIYELRKRYGFSKFIIVVPSIAIYEGVIKTEEITRGHFRSLYGNEPVTLIPYDGSRLSRVRIFATSTQAQILLMTIDTFNSKSNNLYKPSEKLPGERLPYQYIQETRPIVILDEPQNMESARAREALRTLHPLFGLRYSATHRTSPNLLYRLTPVEAYRQNLVKKIQVIGLETAGNLNERFLALESISARQPLTAKVKTYAQHAGVAREAEVTLRHGEDLYGKTKREEHRDGYVVEEINAADEFVRFQNGVRLGLGDTLAPSRPQVFQAQITETVRQHMETQELLRPFGLKVLSLFFIDRVANYTSEQGLVRKLFDEAFERLKAQHEHFSRYRAEEVREAYFAKSRTKKGEDDVAVDTEGRNASEREAEKRAFELIMRDKERLLSFDEPVSFIFAHSALKEGWDNPNVFQICTLNQTVSEIKKRQEIGRGLRLAVNQAGERVTDTDVNVLTVVANESYESYAANLQREYLQDDDEAPPTPKRPQDAKAYRRDSLYTSADFEDFWRKLNRRTSYKINIDTGALIGECIERLKQADFPEPVVVLTRGRFVVTEFTIRLDRAAHGTANITLEIKDTDGRTDTTQMPVSARVDLARVKHDERLRGFKVIEVEGEDDDASVRFANGEELTRYQSIFFKTEKGTRAAVRPTEVLELESSYPVFDFIARAARETSLTRPTLNNIFRGLPEATKRLLFKNPEGFAAVFITEVREALADHVAQRLEFTLDDAGAPYEAEDLFPAVKWFPQKELADAGARGLYDKVQLDSGIEERFVREVLRREEDRIVFYFKFPPKFRVELPRMIGNYNPDWGVVRYDADDRKLKLQLVRETKGNVQLDKLQFSNEGRKIRCAMRHFERLGIDYRHITGREPRWWARAGEDGGTLL
jgi:type III restriction enzyme